MPFHAEHAARQASAKRAQEAALADARDLTLDVTEIEDARWFTRAEVAEAMAAGEGGAFAPAPPQAIAHHMLRWWLEGGAVQKVS